jgi:electron transport complex protein RnfC
LQPFLLSRLSILKQFDDADKNYAADCIECGSCSFICPAKRPLVETIRIAKKEVLAKRRKAVK